MYVSSCFHLRVGGHRNWKITSHGHAYMYNIILKRNSQNMLPYNINNHVDDVQYACMKNPKAWNPWAHKQLDQVLQLHEDEVLQRLQAFSSFPGHGDGSSSRLGKTGHPDAIKRWDCLFDWFPCISHLHMISQSMNEHKFGSSIIKLRCNMIFTVKKRAHDQNNHKVVQIDIFLMCD